MAIVAITLKKLDYLTDYTFENQTVKYGMDISFQGDYFPLVNYSMSDDGDEHDSFEHTSTTILNHTIEHLLSFITSKEQASVEPAKCSSIDHGYIQKKVHMTLESEKGEEERRKSRLLLQTLKKTEDCCSSPLNKIKKDTDVFRRFSPRRVTFIRKNRLPGKGVKSKLTQPDNSPTKRMTTMLQLLVKQGMCLNARD